MAKKAWTQVGTIRQAESGKLYIKFHGQNDKDGQWSTKCLRTLADALTESGKNGISLQIESPIDKLNRLNSLGFIEDKDLDGRIEAVPEYIKYEITLPPQDDD